MFGHFSSSYMRGLCLKHSNFVNIEKKIFFKTLCINGGKGGSITSKDPQRYVPAVTEQNNPKNDWKGQIVFFNAIKTPFSIQQILN